MPGPVFLHGESVSLRTIEEEDLPYLQRVVNDPRVWRGMGRQIPTNGPQETEFFENVVCDEDSVTLLVTIPDEASDREDSEETTGQPVGTVALTNVDHEHDRAEVGYWIDPSHHRQGYGTDAVARLLTYGFDQRGFHRIEARVFASNEPSQALLEGLGFTLEGTLRDRDFRDGSYEDELRYGLLAAEWSDNEIA